VSDEVSVAAPLAVVMGSAITELPKDLYIPPHALEVFLESFEGPLDLLLYLIKRQNIDILNIPIAEITRQYIAYIELMKRVQFELAAEYLVMAALLAEIKSRMLLPRPATAEGEESDPRADLIRRLQEYERYRRAALDLDELPRIGRDLYSVQVDTPDRISMRPVPHIDLKELLMAMADILQRAEMFAHHQIQREPLSVRERMSQLLTRLSRESFTDFTQLFRVEEGRRGVVVTLMAVLELIKQSLVEIIQAAPFSPIHVRLASSEI
jgi:segregation and condensation protein A